MLAWGVGPFLYVYIRMYVLYVASVGMWTTSYVSNIAGCTEPYKFTTTLSLCFGHLIHFVRFPRCLFSNCWTLQIIAGTLWNFSILNVTKLHLLVEKQADTGSHPLHSNQHQGLSQLCLIQWRLFAGEGTPFTERVGMWIQSSGKCPGQPRCPEFRGCLPYRVLLSRMKCDWSVTLPALVVLVIRWSRDNVYVTVHSRPIGIKLIQYICTPTTKLRPWTCLLSSPSQIYIFPLVNVHDKSSYNFSKWRIIK